MYHKQLKRLLRDICLSVRL